MKVKIFTEGGKGIGLGHLSRCCSLYDEVYSRGLEVELIIYGDIINVALSNDWQIKNDNWLLANYLDANIEGTDCCIVDSYLASKDLYEIISNKAKMALYIDDMARINYPSGIIVNPSLYTDSIMYPDNDGNDYLLGYEYIILRTPFMYSDKNKKNRVVKEVLVTMGGTDIRNLTPRIITNICSDYHDIKFNVVINDKFFNIANIESAILKNTKLYYNVDDKKMRDLMVRSDIAITAAGQTIYELLATGTPFIPIKVIENQSNNINGLRKIYPDQISINYDDNDFISILRNEFKLMFDINIRTKWIDTYDNIVDGLGRKRIINRLLGV